MKDFMLNFKILKEQSLDNFIIEKYLAVQEQKVNYK